MNTSMSTFVRGRPFDKPQLQSVLPVVIPRSYSNVLDLSAPDLSIQGEVEFVGFIYVPSTAYIGDELTQTLGTYAAPLAAVYKTDDGLNRRPVSHYMAIIVTPEMALERNYNTLPGFKNLSETGYFSKWTAPSYTEHLYAPGTLISVIEHNLNPAAPGGSGGTSPVIPTVPGTSEWFTKVTAIDMQCAYYDFNWTDMFIQSIQTSDIAFMDYRLEVLSNPPGGEFKATIVKNWGSGVNPSGSRFYDTVRVIRLARTLPAGASSYPFKFEVVVVDKQGNEYRQSVDYTLEISAQG